MLDLRRDLFDHLTSLSLRYFSQQKAGWIIARLTSDVDAISDVLNQGLTTLVVNSLTLVAAIGGLFLLDWRLGVVALIVLPPGIVVTRWFQTASHTAFADVRTRIAAVTAQLAESVAGMAVVQAFSRERAFQREFGDLNEENRVSNVYAQKLSSVFFPAIEFLGVIATVVVLFAGAKLIDGGSLQIGTLIAAIGMLQLVFQPLQELSELYGQVQAASAAMTKISTVLDAEQDITDNPSPSPSLPFPCSPSPSPPPSPPRPAPPPRAGRRLASYSAPASSRRIGVAPPSRSRPSTSTSGPPIMKSCAPRSC